MLTSSLELLRHILEEVEFVLQFTNNKSKEDVLSDAVLCRAIIITLVWITTLSGILLLKSCQSYKKEYR
jgi:uncharacterized protein with HEPN domain